MKKMQCEVCGSNEIKKIDDDIFECQSCGVQYSKTEVQKLLVEIKGEVKIDHSEDINNAIKRAEQFEKSGHSIIAQQYYNKALDLDPDNEFVTKKINEIREFNELSESNMFILEKTITSEEGINRFLKSIKNRNQIVPDIYKKIEIISKTEAFYPVKMVYGKYSGTYSGTACYRRKIPYTDYETKTEYVNGNRQEQRVPVTKYRTEIEKHPANGEFTKSVGGYYVLSDDLYDKLKHTQNVKFVPENTNNNESNETNEGIFSKLESYIESNGPDLLQESVQITDKSFRKNDGALTYSDLNVYCQSTEKTSERAEAKYKKIVELSCESAAEDLIQGDYSSSVKCNYNVDKYREFILYLPLQIIEYAYNGNFYISVALLSDKFDAISMTYPIFANKKTLSKEREINIVNNKLASQKSALRLFIIFAVICGICSILFLNTEYIFVYCVICSIISSILAIVFGVIVSNTNKQVKKMTSEYEKQISEVNSIHSNVLINTTKAFFNEYEKSKSVDSARKAATNVSNYNIDISTVSVSGCGFQKYDVVNIKEKPAKEKIDQRTNSNTDITFCLASIGSNKLQVISIIREELGIGLSEAKKIVDSVPTNINCKDALDADDIIKKLQDAGATIKDSNYILTLEQNENTEDEENAELCRSCLATLKPGEKVCHVCGAKIE